MQLDSLRDLYMHELDELHDSERQFFKVLPKLAKTATSEDLRLAFESHLEQSQEHLRRLELVFARMQQQPKPLTCRAMKGIIEDADEIVRASGDDAVKDAGLISAAQRVDHHQMHRYGRARTYAQMLGDGGSAELLQESLNDGRVIDESLTRLASRLIRTEPVHA